MAGERQFGLQRRPDDHRLLRVVARQLDGVPGDDDEREGVRNSVIDLSV